MTMCTPNPDNTLTPGCTLQRAPVTVRGARYQRAVTSAIASMPAQTVPTRVAATTMVARTFAVMMRASISALHTTAVMSCGTMTCESVMIIVWIEHHLDAENSNHKGTTEVMRC